MWLAHLFHCQGRVGKKDWLNVAVRSAHAWLGWDGRSAVSVARPSIWALREGVRVRGGREKKAFSFSFYGRQ